MSTMEATTISVELPVEFDKRWNRMAGITVEGRQITVNPDEYFFQFDSNTWRLCDWDRVASELLDVTETSEKALDQIVLEFIHRHSYSTADAAKVLATAWQVNNYMFREEHLDGLGIDGFTADHLRMLREVGTFMALNKVEDDGTISNVGPCWMFPAATTVVFDLTDKKAEMVDEVYHGTWFNETRRLEALKANAALGGRLVHGCQSVPSQSGGAIVPFGASIEKFTGELKRFRGDWLERERAAFPKPATREEVRAWQLSAVERVRLPDGRSLIFKYAAEPFTSEHRAIEFARDRHIPVPDVYAAIQRDHMLGMLMQDLGEPLHEANDHDGVHAALLIHAAGRAPKMHQLDTHTLSGLPNLASSHLRRLQAAGRWHGVDDVTEGIAILRECAEARSAGAELEPFGLVHSEFHPTSLHVGSDGLRLLDFARAFNGPGLVDLASWHGTIDAADPDRLRGFLEQYVAAGGAPDTLAKRGGLAAEAWALGWHRVWAIEWFLDQSIRWINNPEDDPIYIEAIRRHLGEALRLLEV